MCWTNFREEQMANDDLLQPARRQFALSGIALGVAALLPAGAAAQTPAAPAQASGPIVLHGVSPRLTVHALDTFHGAAATGLRIDFFRLEGAELQAHSHRYRQRQRPLGRAAADRQILSGRRLRAAACTSTNISRARKQSCPRRHSCPRCRCASGWSTSPSASTFRSSSGHGATPIRAAAEGSCLPFPE